jgi:tetratricopeptide (TPR) repeat protein
MLKKTDVRRGFHFKKKIKSRTFPICVSRCHTSIMRQLMTALCLMTLLPAVCWAQSYPLTGPLQKAQHHWENRVNGSEVEKAAELYQAVPLDTPQAGEAQWQLARCYWWLADHRDHSQRIKNFELANRAAAEAVRLSPDSADAHYWLGACLGLLAAEKNNLGSLRLVEQSIREMHAVIERQPGHGLAQYTLGVLYCKTPGWPFSIGDLQKSLAYARQAVELQPGVVLTHLGLAETLISLNHRDQARQELLLALDLPGPAGMEPETEDQKELARKVLQTLH